MNRRTTLVALSLLIGIPFPTETFGQTSAADFIESGNAKLDKGDVDGAIADLTRSIELNPNDGKAYSVRSRAKIKKGDFQGARADSTRGTELSSRDLKGIDKELKGDFDGSIADSTRDIELNPNDAKAYANRARAKNRKGDYSGAIADCNRAIELDSQNRSAYFTRALARGMKGDREGQIADLTRAIELDPKNNSGYISRASAKERKGDLDGAIHDYDRAIELSRKDYEFLYVIYMDRGHVKRAKGDLDGAIADYDRVTELAPKYTFAYLPRSLAKLKKGDTDGVIDDMTRLIQIEPNNIVAHGFRGDAQFLKRNWAEALADYRWKSDEYFLNRSHLMIWIIRARLGEKEAADKELATHLETRNEKIRKWLQTARARLEEKKGSNKQLIANVEKAEKSDVPEDWTVKVARFLLDRMTQSDLISATASPDAKKERGQDCHVWFFVGMKRLLADDKAGAADSFRKCFATEMKDFIDYRLAQAELKALGQ